eukprot:CAMPEP_0204275882 /NCGR_PEP_ID=MMETSP0468-20130131/26913_1 /ASSEMBLY_ACC=CAM_ASM_000383 /TAXON_ID=2969 /ORGANISM="Oxyrrhis marina" /LENGTH=155 /DNA_ID=CAMNT_0051252345 /DNA_START=33 /DNA_END=500 /DNA_ORIENTATION=+
MSVAETARTPHTPRLPDLSLQKTVKPRSEKFSFSKSLSARGKVVGDARERSVHTGFRQCSLSKVKAEGTIRLQTRPELGPGSYEAHPMMSLGKKNEPNVRLSNRRTAPQAPFGFRRPVMTYTGKELITTMAPETRAKVHATPGPGNYADYRTVTK